MGDFEVCMYGIPVSAIVGGACACWIDICGGSDTGDCRVGGFDWVLDGSVGVKNNGNLRIWTFIRLLCYNKNRQILCKTETTKNENSVTTDKIEEITITIVVTQDKYLLDEQEVTLTQIKEKVNDESAVTKVILEDNYASTKAWDDIKTNLAEWGIIPIEQ